MTLKSSWFAPKYLGDIMPNYVPPAIPFMAAFTIETADLQSAINTLQKNDVSFVEKEGAVIVDPSKQEDAVIFK